MRLKKTEVLEKISNLLSQESDLTPYELKAVKDFHYRVANRGKYLTAGQKSFLLKIEQNIDKRKNQEYSPEQKSFIDRLESLQKEQLTPWEQGFVPSLLSQVKNNRSLSEKQLALLEKVEGNYSKEAKDEKDNWIKNFSQEQKRNFKACVDYYRITHYYRSIVDKVRTNPDYIPTQKEYEVLCNNKFSQRIVKSFNEKPKFVVGQMVKWNKMLGQLFVVSEIDATREVRDYPFSAEKTLFNSLCVSAAKGCRQYKLIPITPGVAGSFVIAEERHIRKIRRNKDGSVRK